MAATVGVAALATGSGAAEAATIAVLDIEGPIGPATADYVERNFAKAIGEAADVIVLRMDTPGGLADSMRIIIQEILAAPVPVVGYVAPSGARAASAGTYILYACQIAAMAPGTNLGAATPIQIGGGFAPRIDPAFAQDQEPEGQKTEPDTDQSAPSKPKPGLEDKMVNDAVAYIRSLAQLRGRNADWAEQAVREAASLSASEALDKNVIDLIARNLDDLLGKIDGRTVEVAGGERTIETADASVVTFEPDWRTELLGLITNPNVAYILMLIGIYGIILEFYNPGMFLPGVAGAISLLLALFAFQVLPVNYAGLALIGLGIGLMVAEMVVPSFGALGIGGVVAFVVGSIMLMDTEAPGFGISWQVVGGIALAAASSLLLLIAMMARSHRRPVSTGLEEMVGSVGNVLDWSAGHGRVRLHGETWSARGPKSLKAGRQVKVKAIHGLTVEVEPEQSEQ
jgi:membrane-bound serine protease (ClpP class)